MAFGFIDLLRGRRDRLPRDRNTRVPGAAKKAAKEHVDAMAAAIDKIGGLPGIADVKQTKRVPRGFYELAEGFQRSYDAYVETVKSHLPLDGAQRAGRPGGTNACFAAPMGVSGIEALVIYRRTRVWKSFPDLARTMGEMGEQQFNDIQAGHKGKDPEKIRVGGRAMAQGRVNFAKRKLPCPYLNAGKGSCQLAEARPSVCRMHFPTGDEASFDPSNEGYPRSATAINIRPPVKVQVALAQLDKRMDLQLSPFLYAGQLQLVQLAEGQMIHEVGEAPQRMGQDGQISRRANRNVKHAKKYKKKKKR